MTLFVMYIVFGGFFLAVLEKGGRGRGGREGGFCALRRCTVRRLYLQLLFFFCLRSTVFQIFLFSFSRNVRSPGRAKQLYREGWGGGVLVFGEGKKKWVFFFGFFRYTVTGFVFQVNLVLFSPFFFEPIVIVNSKTPFPPL